jgi:hypothetical protein
MPERPAAIGELRAQQRKRVAAIRKLNGRYAGRPFPKRAAETWNRLSPVRDAWRRLTTAIAGRGPRVAPGGHCGSGRSRARRGGPRRALPGRERLV